MFKKIIDWFKQDNDVDASIFIGFFGCMLIGFFLFLLLMLYHQPAVLFSIIFGFISVSLTVYCVGRFLKRFL
jgi:UDP-N-acetylmuramyl pentapeptide phosphotransferase/UDP-N-acetylglucosamine-1-phosphate transferase